MKWKILETKPHRALRETSKQFLYCSKSDKILWKTHPDLQVSLFHSSAARARRHFQWESFPSKALSLCASKRTSMDYVLRSKCRFLYFWTVVLRWRNSSVASHFIFRNWEHHNTEWQKKSAVTKLMHQQPRRRDHRKVETRGCPRMQPIQGLIRGEILVGN